MLSLGWLSALSAVSVFSCPGCTSVAFAPFRRDTNWDPYALCIVRISEGSESGAVLRDPFAVNTESTAVVFVRGLMASTEQMLQNYLRKSPQIKHTSFWGFHIISTTPETKVTRNTTKVLRYLKSQSNKYVIFLDSLIQVNWALRALDRNGFNSNAFFLIAFHAENSLDGFRMASELFKKMYETRRIFRIVVLTTVRSANYNVYAPRLFDTKNCNKVKAQLVGDCDNGNISFSIDVINRALNPQIEGNCTFKMCARVYHPYVYKGCQKGFEIQIVKLISEKLALQFKLKCYSLPRGDLQLNGTWTGFFGAGLKDNCDFFVGGIFPDDEVHASFSGVHTYLSETYSWFAKAAGPIDWEAMFRIHQPRTNLSICGTMLLSIILWSLFERYIVKDAHPVDYILIFLNMCAVMLGTSVKKPTFAAHRILFLTMVMFSLITGVAFTSQLIIAFTMPGRQYQISTIEEVISAGIPFGGPSEKLDWFDNSEDWSIFKHFNTSVFFEESYLNLLSTAKGRKVMLLARRYVSSSNWRDLLFEFPRRVFSTPLELVSMKSFAPKLNFTRAITQLTESGVIKKQENELFHELEFIRQRNFVREPLRIFPQALGIKHLTAPFILLLAGLSISFVVFICETEWARQKDHNEKEARAKAIERERRQRRMLKNLPNLYTSKN